MSRPRPSAAAIRARRIGTELGGLVRVASPIAAIGLMNMALGLTDVVMIGRLDPAGLPAIVVVSDLYSILFNFTVGFSAVVAPAAAAAIGAGVHWRVCTIVQRVMLLVSLLAAAGAVLLWFLPEIVLAAGLQLPAPDTTRTYARFMAGAFVALVLFAMARHVLSATGRPRFAVVAIALALPVNAGLNQVFMAGTFGLPALGAAGAGLATLVVALGLGGSTTAYMFLARRFDRFRAPPKSEPVLAPAELLRLARQATLTGLGAIAETGGFLLSTTLVGLAAPALLVAHTLAFRALGLCYLLVAGIGQATTIRLALFTGTAGRRRQRHARTAVSCCGVALMAALAVLFCGFAPWIARLMAWALGIGDPTLVAEAARLVPYAGLALAAAVPAHVVAAALKAEGRALAALGLLAAGHWGLGVPAMLLASGLGLGAAGLWTALAMGAAAASLIALSRTRVPALPAAAR